MDRRMKKRRTKMPNDRPGKPVPSRGRVSAMATVKLGKAPNSGPFGVGSGRGGPGTNSGPARYYPKVK